MTNPKVYVVEVDNGLDYGDSHHWVTGVVTIRKAKDVEKAHSIGRAGLATLRKFDAGEYDGASYSITSWDQDQNKELIFRGGQIEQNDFIEDENIYEANGYKDRTDYLRSLAEENGMDLDTVMALADLLGPTEDFDGLVTELDDANG